MTTNLEDGSIPWFNRSWCMERKKVGEGTYLILWDIQIANKINFLNPFSILDLYLGEENYWTSDSHPGVYGVMDIPSPLTHAKILKKRKRKKTKVHFCPLFYMLNCC